MLFFLFNVGGIDSISRVNQFRNKTNILKLKKYKTTKSYLLYFID